MPRVRQALFAVFAWSVFSLVLAVMFPILVLVYAGSVLFDRRGYAVNCFLGAWAMIYLFLHPGWTFTVEGRRKLPRRGSAILVANHQSFLDVMVVYTLFRPFSIVSKAEVLWMPVLGWCLLMTRPIVLRRGDRQSITKVTRRFHALLRAGRPVLLYPEGTRSKDGRLGTFQRGAFALAASERCPIYPVVIDGTRNALPSFSPAACYHAQVKIRVLDPVHPEAFLGEDGAVMHERELSVALRDHVHRTMAQELANMRALPA